MFNKNFNLSESLIDTTSKLLNEHAELNKVYGAMLEEYGVKDPLQLSEDLQDEFYMLANDVLGETYMGFETLKKAIAARGGVRDPAAVAASIGRKKYGKEKFQKMAAAGKRKTVKEASNEEPNINHLELSEKALDELSPGTMKSYVKKVAATPAGQVKPSREKGIEMASKKLRNEEEMMPKRMTMKERTAFHMAAALAAKQGKPHFEFGGKKFKTTMQKDVAHKMTETSHDDDEDETASKHIIMQLRKSVSLRGRKDVGFNDGKSHKVPAHVASAVLNHYNSLKTADQKDSVQRKIAKSHDHLMKHYNSLTEAKLQEVPIETMKQVKMVHQEEEQDVVHKKVVDPNTDKTVQPKHRKVMDPNTDKSIQEREMTDAEMKKREKIVKALKRKAAGFKERYGEKAKQVMYATATKQAMKEEDDDAPKGKTMTGEKKDGVETKPEMITKGSGGIKSTTT